MVKGRDWTPQTLKDVGGAVGVGLSFLEENFTRPTAPYRRYEKAVIAVLRTLLPEAGTEIRGHLRPEAELRQAAEQSEAEFRQLLQILVSALRLVTPVDPRELEVDDQPAAAEAADRFYQLTHDYLVPSIRSWLNLHLQQTWRGRARLRLDERTAQWTRFRERRFLPGPAEFTFEWKRLTPNSSRSTIRLVDRVPARTRSKSSSDEKAHRADRAAAGER